jgi:2-keto-4-pentenoate hydratase/2-oxohepta-3-ene-1,7-dioic acid hydratase in catechol pathway
MKFVTFEVKTTIGNRTRIGVLGKDIITDLHAAYASYLREVRGIYNWRNLAEVIVPPDMLRYIENGEMAKEATQTALDYVRRTGAEVGREGERIIYRLDAVKLKAPVPRPSALIDGGAFLEHAKNVLRLKELPPPFYEIPAHYRTSHTDVVGTDEPIIWPSYSEQLDYELEFAVCIGKYGVDIPVEKADDYIFGYTVYNDISARDVQGKEMAMALGPAKGKNFWNSNIMGPCLVTPDEIDVSNLRMIARINGEIWSDGNSSTMHFTFPQIISYISKEDPIHPGTFIGSGTVGFGCGRELNRYIKPGDVVELEVEGIGILKNRVERLCK